MALNYMDRYLIVCEVRKNHLQLLAAACLLLASKLREPSCTSLTADILVYFTDNSITKIDLIVSIPIGGHVQGVNGKVVNTD